MSDRTKWAIVGVLAVIDAILVLRSDASIYEVLIALGLSVALVLGFRVVSR